MTIRKKLLKLKFERCRVYGSVTRLKNSLDNVSTKNEILVTLQILDELLQDFLGSDSRVSDANSQLAEFKNKYFQLKSKYRHKLDTEFFRSSYYYNSTITYYYNILYKFLVLLLQITVIFIY